MRNGTLALRGVWGLLGIVFVWGAVMGTVEFVSHRSKAADVGQRVAAKLVSWGFSLELEGVVLPVDSKEINRQLALLKSPISDQRVDAAEWLAARGVRQAGAEIAVAMGDAQTLRPCQLAKSLGALGDLRWADLLVDAARQTTNRDLSVCATLALGNLAAVETVDALVDVYERNRASIFSLDALGKIADVSALDFLRKVADSPRNETERDAALRAIERIEIMALSDPVPVLEERVGKMIEGDWFDEWTIRQLATLGNERAVGVLVEALGRCGGQETEIHISLAAALLAHGQPGLADLLAMPDLL